MPEEKTKTETAAAPPDAEKAAGEKPEAGEKKAEAGERAAKKKVKRNVARAIAYVQSTFNNTIVTITDVNGDTLCWGAAGTIGYTGSRKSTPFAAQRAAEQAANAALKFGVKEIDVRVKGPGSGRESAVRSLQASGLRVLTIEDRTPLPHNGCRPRKRRRV